jgi:hypothetical protein
VSIDDRVQSAFKRLIAGHPELSDGRLTVSNVCLEAAVSRASFYRSGSAAEIRQALSDPKGIPQPDAEKTRSQTRALQMTETALRSQHAIEVRELRATVATYANHIQLLALRSQQLEVDNQRLLHRLEQVGDNITRLTTPR